MDKPPSEPDRNTKPELLELLTELKCREPIFHHPELGTTGEDFNRLTDPDFWEIGASGHRYSREYVWSVLEQRYTADPTDQQGGGWETSEFQLREIAPTYLLTYALLHDAKLTRRATIWQRSEADWTILYHQGTLVSDPVHHRREPELKMQAQ
ncbi:DUF4440 domain-containing protein [Rhodococcus sp. KBS0724]|uniref:nuclear transport factor 2 family protein n=1 Tax=Rhodococcus sp. KBS0724 TaxID=1179674 RepID=UPI00110EEC52|nr:DUF4440 domain-containing protein [Rhodococcus sp. KBS0724]TSD47404.1 DUF4440 domain-containing protein [Rhodococcus sp. KBS0724]